MMHKKNQTSFAQGNQWRFSENCQPIRKMTGKQTLKAIDNLISMSQNEITDVFNPREDNFNTELSFKTQGNIILTSFRTGEVTISYKALPVDETGIPLLIDNANFLKALELYIKKEKFGVLYDEGKIREGIMSKAETDYAFAVAQCEKEFIMPSISELQSITNMWNTLIPNITSFDGGFKNLGNREYLKNQ